MFLIWAIAGQEFRGGSALYPLLGAAGVTGSLTACPGPPTLTRRPAIVQPRWSHGTHIVRTPEQTRGEERFARPVAPANEFRACAPQDSVGGKGNQFSRPSPRSIPSNLPFLMRPGLQTQAQQETHDSQPGQNPTQPQPSLHGESTSRARRKFLSLFNSASSRKQACSFCQAATPSRVASSAPLGT